MPKTCDACGEPLIRQQAFHAGFTRCSACGVLSFAEDEFVELVLAMRQLPGRLDRYSGAERPLPAASCAACGTALLGETFLLDRAAAELARCPDCRRMLIDPAALGALDRALADEKERSFGAALVG